jgi:hypothetical protein
VITPPAPPPPAIVFTPAPAPAPAPAGGFAPAPSSPKVEEREDDDAKERKRDEKKTESATAIVVIEPVLVEEKKSAPAEIKTQEIKPVLSVREDDRVTVKIATSKIPSFKGAGPFRFSLGVKEASNSAAISDPAIAAGVRVISQTPLICKVVSTFDKKSGRYSVSVQGVANGTCRITAIDTGGEENYPAATEISQKISGIIPQKKTRTVAKKPPAPKSGVSKASFKPKK